MIIHTHRLKSATQPVTIAPIGDLQWAGDEEDLAYDLLERHLDDCLARPTPLFIGMGDYIDFASPSNREALEKAVLYDTAKKVISNATKFLVDDLYARLLKRTRGKWLGIGQGHHHHPAKIGELPDGTALMEDSDVYLSKLLKAKWLDEMGVVKIVWPGGGVFRVLAFHGSGSSVFPWGPLMKLYRLMPHFHVDLLLQGHHTKKALAEVDRLEFPVDSDEIKHLTIKMVGTGGWTKGYINGRRTYVSAGALGPVALGQPLIHIRPRVRKGVWEAGFTVES
jgi:hypothetical protein